MTTNFAQNVERALDQLRVEQEKQLSDEILGADFLLSKAYDCLAAGLPTKAAAYITRARAVLSMPKKNPMQIAVEEFMEICDQEVRKYPGMPSDEVQQLRINIMIEELLGSTTPTGHLVLNKSDELVQSIINGDIVGVADGIGDLLYVVFGTASAFGIEIQEVFDEIHRSNLTKAIFDDETGSYILNKDLYGKVIKPESYSPAELKSVVIRQIVANSDEDLELIEIEVPDGI